MRMGKLDSPIREERRLMVIENRELRKIFGPKGRKWQAGGENYIIWSCMLCTPHQTSFGWLNQSRLQGACWCKEKKSNTLVWYGNRREEELDLDGMIYQEVEWDKVGWLAWLWAQRELWCSVKFGVFFNGVSAGCSAASSYLSVCLFVWLVGLVVDWLDSQSVCWLVGWLVGSLII